MTDFLFQIFQDAGTGIQAQLRRQLISAILDGQLAAGQRLPSSRVLAKILGIGRNTVTLAYQGLVDEGYLKSRERSGFFVSGHMQDDRVESAGKKTTVLRGGADWNARLKQRPVIQQSSIKSVDWRKYRYPFIYYGPPDPDIFPLMAWRKCSRQALSALAVNEWAGDRFDSDDPFLVEQICARDLPRRGICASPDQVLVTLGVQHALFLITHLLFTSTTTVGLEEPGYVEARNIFRTKTPCLKPLSVDGKGLVVNDDLRDCEYVYVTPSHQSPTTVTMPLKRRLALIERAQADDFVIIEDDHASETNYVTRPTLALKSLDDRDRVVYIGSFSKYLAPGLRIGYIVGPSDLINEARDLRRLMMRHPPSNNQRTLALFLAEGHYDALIRRLHRVYRERWEAMGGALEAHLPGCSRTPTFGGTSYWLRGPDRLDAEALAREALEHGIVIEPGAVHFMSSHPPRNFFRLGFSSIEAERIEPGIKVLAELILGKAELAAAGAHRRIRGVS